MANNRMFLCFRPTGDAVMLGKRYGYGWIANRNLGRQLQSLFSRIEQTLPEDASQDDFFLGMEDVTDAPGANDQWDYINDGSKFTRIRVRSKLTNKSSGS